MIIGFCTLILHTRFPFKEFPFSLVRSPDSADVDETTPYLTRNLTSQLMIVSSHLTPFLVSAARGPFL